MTRLRPAFGLVAATLAIIVPWLALTAQLDPLALRVLVGGAAVLAVFHGFGSALAVASYNLDSSAWLRIAWGMAVYLLIAGVALLFGRLDGSAIHVIAGVGLALHTLAVAVRAGFARGDARRAAGPRIAWVPIALAAVVVALHAAGAASLMPAGFFDDDGHFLAQLVRLKQTGQLGDAIGYAREAQLGGSVVLGALAGLTGDLATTRVIDGGVALVLTLGLVWSQVRPRTAHAVFWMILVVLLVSAMRLVSPDPAPFWTAIALIVAAYATMARPRDSRPWTEPRRVLPVALLGGALATLRHELIPVGLALAAYATFAVVPRGDRWRAVAWQLVVALAVMAPYAISVVLARADVPVQVASALARGSAAQLSPLLLVVALAAFAIVVSILLVAFRDQRPGRPFVGLSIATGLGFAGLISGAIAGGVYRWKFAAPIVLAWGLVALVEIARSRPPTAIGEPSNDPEAPIRVHWLGYVVALTAVCMTITVARYGKFHQRWWGRYEEMFEDAHQLLHVRAELPRRSVEDELLAALPRGTRVAIWVDHPERLDYRSHDLIDLRTPRLGRLARAHTWAHEGPSSLDHLLDAMQARYVLVHEDDLGEQRMLKDPLRRLMCRRRDSDQSDELRRFVCGDALERLAFKHRTVAEGAGVRLLDRGSD